MIHKENVTYKGFTTFEKEFLSDVIPLKLYYCIEISPENIINWLWKPLSGTTPNQLSYIEHRNGKILKLLKLV